MKRYMTLLLAAVMVLGLAAEASALGYWKLRREGTQTCAFDQQVKTRIEAQEDHKHERVSIGSYIAYWPDDGEFHTSWIFWGWSEMQYRLWNWNGLPWYPSGTYAYCGYF